MNVGAEIKPEFSRPFDLKELEKTPRIIDLNANEEECVLLAHGFDQQSVGSLSANLILVWLEAEEVLSISGRFQAEVIQTCVISLEPISAELDEEINLVFARDNEKSADIVDPEDAEPLKEDVVDLGELVAEEFSLALEPYPRRPDLDRGLSIWARGIVN